LKQSGHDTCEWKCTIRNSSLHQARREISYRTNAR
jgi:hypothetical protein